MFNITSRIANGIIAVRADLPEGLKQALTGAFLDFAATAAGQAAMAQAIGWTALTPADAATTQSLETMERVQDALRGIE